MCVSCTVLEYHNFSDNQTLLAGPSIFPQKNAHNKYKSAANEENVARVALRREIGVGGENVRYTTGRRAPDRKI